MDDLSRFCCLNSECPDHAIRGGKNLSVCGHYGKDGSIRFLRCCSCGDRFSERKGTPLFRSHLTREKATAVLEHIAEGCGVRQTERLVGVHRDTVTRYTRKAGDHALAAHDELVALSPHGRPRSSSMRSGPSSPRRRPAAIAPTRPTTTREITGITSPTTPSTGWSSPSSPGPVTSGAPRPWWASSADGPGAGR